MELEFDKEIDAILRKGRGGIGVSATAVNAVHLDADTIASFAENALPQKAKLLYMEHFADCDGCRKQLSQTILMNNEAVATAASTVSATAAAASIPWYQNLFKTPNLALAMGALVLTFGGVLGFLVLQNQNNSNTATVSQITEQAPQRGGPYFDEAANTAMANTAAPATANKPANVAANAAAPTSAAASNTESNVSGRVDSKESVRENADKSGFATDGVASGAGPEPKPVVAAPPPPPAKKGEDTAAERDEKKTDDDVVTNEPKDAELAKRKQSEDRRGRDMPPAASKTGPSRSGPLQNQTNQTQSNMVDMTVTRLVSGKRFSNRDGVWYDSAYGSQPTTKVARNSDEFKKLDSGLRNIANTLGGTVVVLWKEKAYRIQ